MGGIKIEKIILLHNNIPNHSCIGNFRREQKSFCHG